MRGRTLIALTVLGLVAGVADNAQAQLSPRGIIGGITRPLRQMLGHLGHFPRSYRHRTAAAEPRAGTAPANEPAPPPGSRLGWAGPPAWPSAYEDVLGFIFWPDDFGPRLRSRGFDVIADTISGRFDMPRNPARIATTGAAVRNDGSNDGSKSSCDEGVGKRDNWPASRIEQTLQLSDTRHDALAKLQAAAMQSLKALKTDCGASAELSPPERLDALVQALWAVRDAGIFIRVPLKSFYDGLTSTQKNSFVRQQPQSNVSADAKGENPGMNKQYQACALQNSERAERLIKEIEMRVRPTNEQAASFENFHKTSSNMAKLLIASCAQPIPSDPAARLDDANDELTAINYAATTVQIAFNDFYGRLDNGQKARFNAPNR